MPESFGDALFRYVAGRVAPYLGLQPPAFDLAAAFQALESKMSALTDQVDAALATLAGDSTNFKAALDALGAARDTIQAQLTEAQATITADEAEITLDKAELQKALDALNASHAAFSGGATPPGGVTTEPSTG